ncbi:DUF4262 domain-containing protein [Pseudomonas sp. Marseille-P9899]|uniref:DUF4262 domain-containing protein n=1 Tax=Pseudomonas sp. Marseille-P9899 TaxID=2730401 RepID=UPI00158A721B|nr:DUF4262 domain-containing protein [Pseudomonas sp. Marseille-P9899]
MSKDGMTLFTLLLCLFPLVAEAKFIRPIVPGFEAPRAETRLDVHILGKISNNGWYPVHVAPQGPTPGFSYSLGFYANYGQAEVVVVGLPPLVAQEFLGILAERVIEAAPPFEMYKGYDGIAEGSQIAFVPVAMHHFPDHFDYGGWFYYSMDTDVPFVQMVWPDATGKFPWEKGYDPVYRDAQPLLNK